VPRAIKDALHLPDELGRSQVDILIEHLGPRKVLLLLDNCEHLISACAEVVEALLAACPHLHILATSREALRCAGEVVWRVPSLTTPTPDAALPVEQLAAYEAVQLFTLLASAARPDFQLTQANAAAVARICARLDGIPLAIEMAAAQVAAMSTQEIAARLDDRFVLLMSGRRAALPRQRTLHATLEWSYSLLTEPERVLLARLAVFADGCTAELAQVVCAQAVCAEGDEQAAGLAPAFPAPGVLHPSDVLPLLIGLVGKSLVVAEIRGEGTRYRLLETVRQYAAEKLAQRGETDILYRRLAAHLTEPKVAPGGFLETDWWQMFLAELGNARELILWARSKAGGADIILRVACAFADFSFNLGYISEPLAWLEEGLATAEGIPAKLRVQGLYKKLVLLMFAGYNIGRWSAEVDELMGLVDPGDTDLNKGTYFLLWGLAAVGRGDLAVAEERFERMRAFAQKASFRFDIGVSLFHQALVRVVRGDKDGAAELLRQSYALGTAPDLAMVLILRPATMLWVDATQSLPWIEHELAQRRSDESFCVGYDSHDAAIGRELQLYVQALLLNGDMARAEVYVRESLDLYRALNLAWSHGYGIAEALLELGRIAWLRDDFGAARAYGEECLELYLRAGDVEHTAQAHTLLGYAALGQDDLDGAAKSLRRGLSLFDELDQPAGTVVALAGLAALAEAQGDPACAARLYGAADVPPQSLLLWLSWALSSLRLASRLLYDHAMAAARPRYAGTPYGAAWAEGRAMSMEQAVEYALAYTHIFWRTHD
jgi:predicted ATPase